MPDTPRPEYLTPDQVGELLQLSAKSIYRLVKDDPTGHSLSFTSPRGSPA